MPIPKISDKKVNDLMEFNRYLNKLKLNEIDNIYICWHLFASRSDLSSWDLFEFCFFKFVIFTLIDSLYKEMTT